MTGAASENVSSCSLTLLRSNPCQWEGHTQSIGITLHLHPYTLSLACHTLPTIWHAIPSPPQGPVPLVLCASSTLALLLLYNHDNREG